MSVQAQLSEREQRRLAALHEYGLLDAPADHELDAVVRVAAAVAGVPTATLNLIDERRQCQLTTVGFEGADSARDESMCAISFESGRFVHVPDASVDPTYRANPWVTGILADVRFYASAPLVTAEGHALGTLCVFDSEVGQLCAEQIARLRDLADIIVALFERRRQARVNAALAAAAEQAQAELAERGRQLAATIAELQRSNAELTQFAGAVSHDLLAPLGIVRGYLELLNDLQGQPLDDKAGEWIATADRAAQRMQELIAALLSYARAGNAPVRHCPTDLGDVLDQVLADLRVHIEAAGATVTGSGLPTVSGDPTLLRQLLQNLVGNALKYRHPERPCRVTVAAAPHRGNGYTVTVTDNGIGIPAEHRQRVFEMFTRVDPRPGTGHGIGLSTCQRIVDRHGGRIRAAGSAGGGTTINFTLPGTGPGAKDGH